MLLLHANILTISEKERNRGMPRFVFFFFFFDTTKNTFIDFLIGDEVKNDSDIVSPIQSDCSFSSNILLMFLPTKYKKISCH